MRTVAEHVILGNTFSPQETRACGVAPLGRKAGSPTGGPHLSGSSPSSLAPGNRERGELRRGLPALPVVICDALSIYVLRRSCRTGLGRKEEPGSSRLSSSSSMAEGTPAMECSPSTGL